MENTTQNKAGATYLVQGSFGTIQNKNLFRAYAAYDREGLEGLPLNKDGGLCGTIIYADTTNTAINQHIKRNISK